MKYERKVKKILEGKAGGGRKKEDSDVAGWICSTEREECGCKKVKKKSFGQNRMDIGLCREVSQGQT
jgi:hypothetical protein